MKGFITQVKKISVIVYTMAITLRFVLAVTILLLWSENALLVCESLRVWTLLLKGVFDYGK